MKRVFCKIVHKPCVNGGISLASKMLLRTKIVHIKFQFLTHSLIEIISLTDFLKDLYSAAIVVT